MDWDAVKLFLALYRAGSARGVALEIGSSASTITRKISRLENSLDVKLFNRHSAGFKLTESGQELLNIALKMESDACEIERKVQGRHSIMQGLIRLTVPSHFTSSPFIDYLSEFNSMHPKVDIQLIPSFDKLNLNRGEADIAIRIFVKDGQPPQELIGTKLVDLHCANYASRTYLKQNNLSSTIGSPEKEAYNSSINWLGWGEDTPYPDWVINSCYPNYPTKHCFSDPLSQMHAAKAGLGLTMNACFLCDAEGALVRIPDDRHWHRFDVWMLSHPDLRDAARFRALRQFLKKRFIQDRDQWSGDLCTEH